MYGTAWTLKMAAPIQTQCLEAAIVPPEQSLRGCEVGKTAQYGTAQAGQPRALLNQTGSRRVRQYGCDSGPRLSRAWHFGN